MVLAPWTPPLVLVAVDLVILTLRGSVLSVLVVRRGIDPFQGMAALPGGFLGSDQEGLLAAAHRAFLARQDERLAVRAA